MGYYDVSGYGDHGSLTINSSRYPSNVRAVAALQRRAMCRAGRCRELQCPEKECETGFPAAAPIAHRAVSSSQSSAHPAHCERILLGQSHPITAARPKCFDSFESFEDVAVSGDCQNGLTQCRQAVLPHSEDAIHLDQAKSSADQGANARILVVGRLGMELVGRA